MKSRGLRLELPLSVLTVTPPLPFLSAADKILDCDRLYVCDQLPLQIQLMMSTVERDQTSFLFSLGSHM